MKRTTGYIVFASGLCSLILFAVVYSVHAGAAAGTAGGPAQQWDTYVPSLTAKGTASTFTPDTAITVSRIQVQVASPAKACKTNAVLQISNSTAAGTYNVPLTSSTYDSGPLSLSYSAGVPISLSVSTAGECASPSAANVVIQYDTSASQDTATLQKENAELRAQLAALKAEYHSLVEMDATLQVQLAACD